MHQSVPIPALNVLWPMHQFYYYCYYYYWPTALVAYFGSDRNKFIDRLFTLLLGIATEPVLGPPIDSFNPYDDLLRVSEIKLAISFWDR